MSKKRNTEDQQQTDKKTRLKEENAICIYKEKKELHEEQEGKKRSR
jgi:hypothetical protein